MERGRWSWQSVMNLHISNAHPRLLLPVSKKQLWPHPAEPFISWGWLPLSNKGSIWLMTEIYMLTYAFLIRRLGMIFLAVALVPNSIMSVLLGLCPAKSAFNNHHIKNCCWQGKGSRLQSILDLAVQQKYVIIVCSKSLSNPRPESSICNLLESTGQGAKRN